MTTEKQYLEYCDEENMYQSIQNLLALYGAFASIPQEQLDNLPTIKSDIKAFNNACAAFSLKCNLPKTYIYITVRTLYIAALQQHMMSDAYNVQIRQIND